MMGRKLEAVQERVGRRLLGGSRSVAGIAVRGELGWWSLEERREEKKLLYGRRFYGMEDDRLVKKVMECVKRVGPIGWWGEFQDLLRKYELDGVESVAEWRRVIVEKVVRDLWDHVEDKSSLKWYKWVKEGLEVEEYLRLFESYDVRLRFRLRCGAAGLLEDKRKCRLCEDSRCVLCDDDQVEDLVHFLVVCAEFNEGRRVLVEEVKAIEGAEEWVEEFRSGDEVGKMLLMLGRRMEGLDEEVSNRVDICVGRNVGEWWKRRKTLMYGEPSCLPDPSVL